MIGSSYLEQSFSSFLLIPTIHIPKDLKDSLESEAKLRVKAETAGTNLVRVETEKRQMAIRLHECEKERKMAMEEMAVMRTRAEQEARERGKRDVKERARRAQEEAKAREEEKKREKELSAQREKELSMAEATVRRLQDENARLVGHQNTRQKINYHVQIKEENNQLVGKLKQQKKRIISLERKIRLLQQEQQERQQQRQ